MATVLEAELASGKGLNDAMRALLSREIPGIKRILFNGDGYADDWRTEAENRGLLNLRTTLDALAHLTDEKNVALFEKYGVLTRRELESREEIYIDQYFKTVNIEGETTADMARTMLLPAAVRYLNELLEAAERAQALGLTTNGVMSTIQEVNELIDEFVEALRTLVEQNAELGGDDVRSKARHMRDNIIPAMQAVRAVADRLEKLVPDDLWPLPTYREMMFVK